MPKRSPVLNATALALLLPLSSAALAETSRPPLWLAMMDMMPMGGATQQPAPGAGAMPGMPAAPTAQPASPVPAPPAGGMGGMMDEDMMPMGGGAGTGMPAAPGAQAAPPASAPPAGGGTGGMMGNEMMPMGGGGMPAQGQSQMPMGQQPMAMCPMMAMMQNMMRMGAAQQGMPAMQGGTGPGAAMGMGTMGGAMAGGTQAMGSSAARLDGRIAFLRTELRVTDPQAAAWESFAAALRAGRDHLDAARTALQDSTTGADPMARLESYENHLTARTEAIRTTRLAFNTLYGQLDEAQKRAATTTMLPFIGAF